MEIRHGKGVESTSFMAEVHIFTHKVQFVIKENPQESFYTPGSSPLASNQDHPSSFGTFTGTSVRPLLRVGRRRPETKDDSLTNSYVAIEGLDWCG